MTTAHQQPTAGRSDSDEAALLGELAEALRRVGRGDLKVRLPRRAGMAGEVADAFNEVVSLQERQNLDVRRISRIVGRAVGSPSASTRRGSTGRGPRASGRSTR